MLVVCHGEMTPNKNGKLTHLPKYDFGRVTSLPVPEFLLCEMRIVVSNSYVRCEY